GVAGAAVVGRARVEIPIRVRTRRANVRRAAHARTGVAGLASRDGVALVAYIAVAGRWIAERHLARVARRIAILRIARHAKAETEAGNVGLHAVTLRVALLATREVAGRAGVRGHRSGAHPSHADWVRHARIQRRRTRLFFADRVTGARAIGFAGVVRR